MRVEDVHGDLSDVVDLGAVIDEEFQVFHGLKVLVIEGSYFSHVVPLDGELVPFDEEQNGVVSGWRAVSSDR